LSLLLFSTSASIVYWAFRTVTPAAVIAPLAALVFGYVALWCVLVLVMIARRPSAAEAVRVWGKVTLGLILTGQVICIWLTWGVLPYGPVSMQYLACAIIMTNAPAQVISSPENTLANRIGIIAVNGSLALYLMTRGWPLARELAVYVLAFAGLMYVLSGTISRTVLTTVQQRLASERAARALEEALNVVAAERDAKTRFISSASHDLGQPLQAAALFFDQTLTARDEEDRGRAVGGVRRSLAAAEALLSHMLNHLRLEADAVTPRPLDISARQLIERIAAQYAPAAAAAGLCIRTAGRDYVLRADPQLVHRALGNLTHNAIGHSHAKTLLLGARRLDAGAVRLWVIDNGMGVEPAEADRIFEDYHQGPRPAHQPRLGFGLGLSSVRRIAQLSGGQAGLDTRWTGGAAFFIDLPAVSANPAAAVKTAPAPALARV
jgi:signal transduction histidine kinase